MRDAPSHRSGSSCHVYSSIPTSELASVWLCPQGKEYTEMCFFSHWKVQLLLIPVLSIPGFLFNIFYPSPKTKQKLTHYVIFKNCIPFPGT